ncbi:exopolysaccharide biosynthesis polyprenyl glycosylphosphotransferase [Prevotella sp. tc2-28]|uniref:exopolysaccharide biosynthesis polyprenyl glycosylphosphotransferase n=1 Tax=Prevotella sp. tc2-28 TaxID=1761888 RepID=UPI00115FEC5C|nr:exopolysaccharide biosynthesis polyprenyl glycosylphosphotransferase [Prevotella sp. tc2-28]
MQKSVIAGDFIVFNLILGVFALNHWRIEAWEENQLEVFGLVGNLALVISQLRFSPTIHQRVVGAGDILRRIMGMTILQAIVGYLLLKIVDYNLPVGWLIWEINTVFFVSMVFKRMIERQLIRFFREAGRNTRMVTLVGSDTELVNIYRKLMNDATLGYRVIGYYDNLNPNVNGNGNLNVNPNPNVNVNGNGNGNRETISGNPDDNLTFEDYGLRRLGSIDDMLAAMARHEDVQLGDEVYVCLSRRDGDVIKKISRYCDYKVVRFFYVPVSVESIGLNLKRELMDDIEIYTTYEIPLQNLGNRMIKRAFDIVASLIFLIPTALMFPFIWLIIKIQSPGPIFFKQARTGIDGKTFMLLKFRSMHVNKDADRLQATKDDPRKFPFGNFMRKSNIDELPQFLNVLKGDMSFVGPRPHMLAHTEQYSALITKYMVRHFVKPGLTGWAQVTGFRGETKELWQMEGRVKRDIWYMEHWSIWLDIRIVWLTVKTIFIHDEHAY